MKHFLQTVAMKSVITLVIITDNFMKVVTVTESNSHLNDRDTHSALLGIIFGSFMKIFELSQKKSDLPIMFD